MANPYEKYLGKEDKLQSSIIKYLDYRHKNVIYTHPSNEGKRTSYERFKLKILGVKAGVPDLLIFNPNKSYNGLAIELKIKYNKPTPKQIKWLTDLEACGWYTTIGKDFDSVIELIEKYLKDEL